MCTKYINNHKLCIHINFIGTGRDVHAHAHAHAHTHRGLQGVPSVSESTLCVPALLLPVPLLVLAQSGHPIATSGAILCTDLQIICSFTHSSPQAPQLSLFFPIFMAHSVTLQKVMNVTWWMQITCQVPLLTATSYLHLLPIPFQTIYTSFNTVVPILHTLFYLCGFPKHICENCFFFPESVV